MHARQNRAVAAGVVALALATVTGCGNDTSSSADPGAAPQSSQPSATPTASASASIPAGDGPIEPGEYRIPSSAWSVTDFTVTFPKGWIVQYGHVYGSNQDEDDEFGFYAVVVDEIWAEACAGGDSGATQVGPTVDDLANALLEQPGPNASKPVQTTLGGYPATRIDLTVPKGFDLEPCNASGIGLQIWFSQPADKNFVLLDDGIASVYILDVGGERQVFLTQHGESTSAEQRAELQAVLDSIQLEA